MKAIIRKHRRWILFFWGGLDALLVMFYVQASLHRGDLPYVDDMSSAINLLEDFNGLVVLLIMGGFLLHFSTFFSAVLLLLGRRSGIYLGLLQVPLRVLGMLPSLSFFLIFLAYFPIAVPWVLVAFVVLSESLKTYTLWQLL